MGLTELVVRHRTSVRLQHAFVTSSGLSLKTVGDYIAAGELASAILQRQIPHFGTKTAAELAQLVASAVLGWNAVEGTFKDEVPSTMAAKDVDREMAYSALSDFGDRTVREVLATDFLSTRLTRIVRETAFGEESFRTVMADFPAVEARLLQGQNVGRRTLRELFGLASQHVKAKPGRGDPSARPLDQVSAAPNPQSFSTLFEAAFAQLPERQVLIIRRRHGIAQDQSETLDQIGMTLGVTRERIRQVEAMALKRLRIQLGEKLVEICLAAETPGIWESLTKRSFLIASDLQKARRRIDPYVELAFSVLNKRFDEWLDSIATRFEFGWYRGLHTAAGIRQVAATLSEGDVARFPLPRTLQALLPSHDAGLCEAAVKLVLGWHLEAGYLTRKRPGPRLARAIHLHATLACSTNAVDIVDLVGDYWRRRPADPCSIRDATIVMEAAPHLFLEVVEDWWTALGAGGEVTPYGTKSRKLQAQSDTQDQDQTISGMLSDILRRTGPARFIAIRDAAEAVLPADRSVNSVGPTLLTRRETFVRLLPGVYSLHDQVPSDEQLLSGDVPYLLTELQARLFAMGRRAGESWGVFPLWRPAAEFRLCQWARLGAPQDCFRSLMAVASVDAWPVSHDLREEWRQRASLSARFLIGTSLKTGAYRRPELDRVLAACLHSREVGAVNWMAANRIDRSRIDSCTAAGLLAILAAGGAITTPETSADDPWAWQLPHAVSATVDDLVGELTDELHNAGELLWNGEAGGRLIERIKQRLGASGNWIDAESALDMLAGQTVDTPQGAISDADAAELMIAAQRRRLDAQKREETLQWLLAG